MKIGIGITTRNRTDVRWQTFINIMKYTPPNFKLVVVDDASTEKGMIADYHFEERAGIPKAKNKCLELLQDCDHIFLFDDDCYPISEDWWKPYVEHKEPHLMYQFKLTGKPPTDMRVVHRGEDCIAYSHTRGAMIYLERRVLDVVGGFDTAYGYGGFEHPDFTTRIHNAGLTTHRAMDIPNSAELLYCLDQDSKVKSTLVIHTKERLANYRLYDKSRGSKEYKEFRS